MQGTGDEQELSSSLPDVEAGWLRVRPNIVDSAESQFSS